MFPPRWQQSRSEECEDYPQHSTYITNHYNITRLLANESPTNELMHLLLTLGVTNMKCNPGQKTCDPHGAAANLVSDIDFTKMITCWGVVLQRQQGTGIT